MYKIRKPRDHQFRHAARLALPLAAFATFGELHAQMTDSLPVVEVLSNQESTEPPRLDSASSTGSRLGLTRKETPASVDTITQKAMQDRGDRTVVEATQRAAGITSGVTGGTPGQFSVRGFNTNGVTWLYNGVRVPGGTGMSARVLDTANLESIEVLRGPASVLNGESGIGGTINMIPRLASFSAQAVEIDYALSSYDSQRLHVGTGGVIRPDTVAYRVDLSTNQYGSHVNGERNKLDRFTGSLLFKLRDDMRLTLELDRSTDEARDFYWGTPLVNGKIDSRLRGINYNNLTDNIFESSTTWTRANYEWDISADTTLRNQLYVYDSYRSWRNVENYRFNDGPNPTVTRTSWGDLDHSHELVGNRTDLIMTGLVGKMPNKIVIGADFSNTDFQTQRNGFPGTQTVDAFNPPAVSFNSVATANRSPARDVNIRQVAIYVEDQLTVTEKLKFVGGVRHDKLDIDWIYFDQAGSPAESKQHSKNSYRTGLVYDLTAATTFYGSYATAAEAGGTLLLLNRNQSQLDLTQAKQLEIGLKQEFANQKGEWTLALYNIEKRNVFVPDPVNPVNRLPVGKQSSQGVELTAWFKPNRQWLLEGNLAYVDAVFDEFSTGNPPVSRTGNTPSFVPDLVANLGTSYSPNEQWHFGAWLRRVDNVFVDDANSTELPAYTTLDLSGKYKLNSRTSVEFRVRNATDELYATWASGVSQVIIANPRTYELGVRMKF